MLGITRKDNDLFVFFENGELSRSNVKIRGSYININPPGAIGELELVLDEEICRKMGELIVTTAQKTPKGIVSSMHISMMQRIYDEIIEKGRYELHEGYRHINLLDATRLDFFYEFLYKDLKDYLAQRVSN